MATYKYEFRKRWNDKLPRDAIKSVVSRMHVSMTAQEVADDIRSRATKAGTMPANLIEQACEYAALCHKANVDLYVSAMRGSYR